MLSQVCWQKGKRLGWTDFVPEFPHVPDTLGWSRFGKRPSGTPRKKSGIPTMSEFDHLQFSREIERKVRVLKRLTGIPMRLIFRAVEWQTPFSFLELLDPKEGETVAERIERNFHFPDFEAAEVLLRELGDKGADILYLGLLLIWHIDEAKKYECVFATEEELRELDAQQSAARTIRRWLDEDLPELNRTFGTERLERLREAVEGLARSERLTTKLALLPKLKPEFQSRKGRPGEYQFNRIMMLISRHLRKTTRSRSGYGSISRLMQACFPKVFGPSFCKSDVLSRIRYEETHQPSVKHCNDFELRFSHILEILRNRPAELTEFLTQDCTTFEQKILKHF